MRQMPCVANGEDKSGSTAVSTLISPTHFYIANCGDSRAVLCRNGVAAVCTMDHKPTVAAEKKRIQDAGGSVMIHRVNGSLAVSRALGDFEYKSVEGRGTINFHFWFTGSLHTILKKHCLFTCVIQDRLSSWYLQHQKSTSKHESRKKISSSYLLAMESGT